MRFWNNHLSITLENNLLLNCRTLIGYRNCQMETINENQNTQPPEEPKTSPAKPNPITEEKLLDVSDGVQKSRTSKAKKRKKPKDTTAPRHPLTGKHMSLQPIITTVWYLQGTFGSWTIAERVWELLIRICRSRRLPRYWRASGVTCPWTRSNSTWMPPSKTEFGTPRSITRTNKRTHISYSRSNRMRRRSGKVKRKLIKWWGYVLTFMIFFLFGKMYLIQW